ncbi:hypothetical protein ACJX0J_038072, partial [Zea mays]
KEAIETRSKARAWLESAGDSWTCDIGDFGRRSHDIRIISFVFFEDFGTGKNFT